MNFYTKKYLLKFNKYFLISIALFLTLRLIKVHGTVILFQSFLICEKTSINILCIFIIAILASSVITPAYYICTVFISGVKSGYSQYQGHISETASLDSYKPTQTVPVDLSFSPDIPTMLAGSDTITIGNSEHYPLTFTAPQSMCLRKNGENRFLTSLS